MSVDRLLRVLVIDDEPQVCRLFVSAASRLDLDVATAGTGTSGLALTRDRTFDVILLDLRMPGMSGLAVLKALRAGGNCTPVVIYTAFPDADSAFEAGRWGAVQYLEKQRGLHALSEALRDAAGLRHAPQPVARRVDRLDRLQSPWTRARAWAGARIHGEATQAAGDLLNVFIEASLDVETTLAQFALLTSVVRAALAGPSSLGAAQELLAGATAAPGDHEGESLAVRLLVPFATPLGLREEALGRDLAMDTSTVRRHLWDLFRCGFHALRWAALIRPAVGPVARSSEPIGNVAINCGCGTDAGLRQFHRAWANALGVTASEFRDRCVQ
jgi:DNA-binding response OmpR family regulator